MHRQFSDIPTAVVLTGHDVKSRVVFVLNQDKTKTDLECYNTAKESKKICLLFFSYETLDTLTFFRPLKTLKLNDDPLVQLLPVYIHLFGAQQCWS